MLGDKIQNRTRKDMYLLTAIKCYQRESNVEYFDRIKQYIS